MFASATFCNMSNACTGSRAEKFQPPRLHQFGNFVPLAGHQIPGQSAAVAVKITLRYHGSTPALECRHNRRDRLREQRGHAADRVGQFQHQTFQPRVALLVRNEQKLIQRPRNLVLIIARAVEGNQRSVNAATSTRLTTALPCAGGWLFRRQACRLRDNAATLIPAAAALGASIAHVSAGSTRTCMPLSAAGFAAARRFLRALPLVGQINNIRPRPCCRCGEFRLLPFGAGGFIHHGLMESRCSGRARCSWVSGARMPLTAHPTGARLVWCQRAGTPFRRGCRGANAPARGVGRESLTVDATGHTVAAHPIRAGLASMDMVWCREGRNALSSWVQGARKPLALEGCNGRAKRRPCHVERRASPAFGGLSVRGADIRAQLAPLLPSLFFHASNHKSRIRAYRQGNSTRLPVNDGTPLRSVPCEGASPPRAPPGYLNKEMVSGFCGDECPAPLPSISGMRGKHGGEIDHATTRQDTQAVNDAADKTDAAPALPRT